MCCHAADTPGTGTADFKLFIHFVYPLNKEAGPDGDFVPTIAMSVVKAEGIEIPKVNLHVAD